MPTCILSEEDRRKLEEAMQIGRDNTVEYAVEYHARMKGYRPESHAAADADVVACDAALSLLAGLPKVQDGARLDFRDVIRNPTDYLVDGQGVLTAQLIVKALHHTIVVHAHDYGLQETRITPAAMKEHPQP